MPPNSPGASKAGDESVADFLRGNLDLMVLSVLADGPKYGYLLQQRLREAAGARLDFQAGTLYPLLHRLEADKFVRTKWETTTGRRRKWYELTAAGRKRLEHQARAWHDYAECLRRLLEPILPAPAPSPA
jgi:PadR family transcriptional regulator, regulatory protein PadR